MTCVLAYGLYNAIEERLRHHERSESPTTVFQALASGQINRLRIKTTGSTRLTLTEPSDMQRTYLEALDCEFVVASFTCQPILHAMQSWW